MAPRIDKDVTHKNHPYNPKCDWEWGWIWNLHGELIDFSLEKMSNNPDDDTCTFDHYLQACRLGDKYYSTIYPPSGNTSAITK